jgi:hypothetical protein
MDQVPQFQNGMSLMRWSVVDKRHRPTGNTRQLVDVVLQGPAAGLAIYEAKDGSGFYLFGCDTNWQVITDTWHASLKDAMREAEFEYEGITATWRAG